MGMRRRQTMVADWLSRLTALLLAAFILGAVPVAAHKNEQHDKSAPAAAAQAPGSGAAAARPGSKSGEADHMAEMMAQEEKGRSAMSTGERLLDWLGRLHPVVIHFP